MATIKLLYDNILEDGTLTIETGTENANFPKEFLHNRGIQRISRVAVVGGIVDYRIDQSAAPVAVQALIIPAGHTLDGVTLDWQYSGNDFAGGDDNNAVSQWVQSGSGQIVRVAPAAITDDYWRLYASAAPSSTTDLDIAEIFMGGVYNWETVSLLPIPRLDPEHNTEHRVSSGGDDRAIKRGGSKIPRFYTVVADETQRASIEAFNAEWDGYKFFYLQDHEGTWIFGRLRAPLMLEKIDTLGNYRYNFDFIEVL